MIMSNMKMVIFVIKLLRFFKSHFIFNDIKIDGKIDIENLGQEIQQ